jgi:hypothetical protein
MDVSSSFSSSVQFPSSSMEELRERRREEESSTEVELLREGDGQEPWRDAASFNNRAYCLTQPSLQLSCG